MPMGTETHVRGRAAQSPPPSAAPAPPIAGRPRAGGRAAIAAVAAAALVLGLAAWLASRAGVPISDLTRDASAVVGRPPYVGLISNLGILVWIATAAIALFAGAVAPAVRSGRRAGFLLAIGAFTLWLGLDDLLLVHERLAPAIGIRERYVIAAYGLTLATLLIAFRDDVAASRRLPMVAAGGLFTVSLAIDKLQKDVLPQHHLFEDGAKFLGIVCWCVWIVGIAAQRMMVRPR